ncbi:uncharacterized protein LOC135694523 [Rhopilema esculentum]|uniref:uncharacterized protein LOC135694523 n=1 Tax=Rhopilema esculentum TaxID=499914 RepID=UPI0031E2D80C
MEGKFMLLTLCVAFINVEGTKTYKHGTVKTSSNVRKELINIKQHIDRIVKIYAQEHLIWVQRDKLSIKKNLAVTCRNRIIKEKMSTKHRAREILETIQTMVNELQQMQIDESRLPSGKQDLAKELRHLEFDLRDIAESMFTRTVKRIIGQSFVPYSVGSLPNNPSPYCCRPKTVRAINVLQLHMLQSCIWDIIRALKKELHYLVN